MGGQKREAAGESRTLERKSYKSGSSLTAVAQQDLIRALFHGVCTSCVGDGVVASSLAGFAHRSDLSM